MTVIQLRGIALGLNHVELLAQAGALELDGPAWKETQAEIQNGSLEPCEVDLRLVHKPSVSLCSKKANYG